MGTLGSARTPHSERVRSQDPVAGFARRGASRVPGSAARASPPVLHLRSGRRGSGRNSPDGGTDAVYVCGVGGHTAPVSHGNRVVLPGLGSGKANRLPYQQAGPVPPPRRPGDSLGHVRRRDRHRPLHAVPSLAGPGSAIDRPLAIPGRPKDRGPLLPERTRIGSPERAPDTSRLLSRADLAPGGSGHRRVAFRGGRAAPHCPRNARPREQRGPLGSAARAGGRRAGGGRVLVRAGRVRPLGSQCPARGGPQARWRARGSGTPPGR